MSRAVNETVNATRITTRLPALFAPLFLLTVFCGFYITPLWDIDFWWHAATGRELLAAGEFGHRDPLGVYQVNDLRGEVLIRAYWLSQLAFHAILAHVGSTGIILLRAAMLTLILALVIVRARQLGAPYLWACIAAILVGVTMLEFSGGRPALFSFVGAAILFTLVDKVRHRPNYLHAAGVVLLMALWANSHGGAALGAVILLITLLSTQFEERGSPLADKRAAKLRLIAILLAVGMTLLTPNGIKLYQLIWEFQGGEIQARTSEYMSPFAVLSSLHIYLPAYWALVLAAVLITPGAFRRREFAFAATALFLLAISLTAIRYIPFFLLFMAPHTAAYLARRVSLKANANNALSATLIVGLGIATLWGINSGRMLTTGLEQGRFPVPAVNFLQQHALGGKILNHINWGGYIGYHLGKSARVFIDGRNLEHDVFAKYTHLLWVTGLGAKLLDKEGFDLVIMPDTQPLTGERYPLNNYLKLHPSWVEIYSDQYSRIYCNQRRVACDRV